MMLDDEYAISQAEFDANTARRTKWTAEILEKERRMVLNCHDLGQDITMFMASYYYENWPHFDIGILLNGRKCLMGHQHSLLATSGGIFVTRNPSWATLEYVGDQSEMAVFRNGDQWGFATRETMATACEELAKIDLWISDPRLQFVAYAILLEDPALFRLLIDPLPTMEDAIMFLRHYDLYRPRLNFSLNCFGHDPYAQLHNVRDDLTRYGRNIINVLKEGV